MKLKSLLMVVSVILLAALLGSTLGCQTASQTIKWRMATSWSEDNLFYTEAAQKICNKVKELSNGRLLIEPAPAGKIVAGLEVMEAVSKGTVEMGHSWSGYWLDKDPVFELFTSIPDQMTAQEWLVWLYGPSQGIKLWQDLYAGYNIVPVPGGLVGPEFGFFTKNPVRSLDDFKGLKLRVTGLAAEVVKELGATTVLTVPGDIKSAMEKGEIDGFEFSTPAVDWPMGFQEYAGYISLPSWHQPSAMFETIINKDAYNQLPADLQAILVSASKEIGIIDYFTSMEGKNAEYLSKYQQYGTQINVLDDEAVLKISEITNRLADQKAALDGFYGQVLSSQRSFLREYRSWEVWGDKNLYPNLDSADQLLATVLKQLNNRVDLLKEDLAQASQQLSEVSLTGEEARVILRELLADRPWVVDVCTINRSGIMSAVEPAEYQKSEGTDISTQPQVISLFRTLEPVMSANFRMVESFEASDMEYPIFDQEKKLKGSVSALIKPEVLLGDLISAAVKGTPFQIWAMQPDGRIVYDVDTTEIGENAFLSPMYEPYKQLIDLSREISSSETGAGTYSFLNTGMEKPVEKDTRWRTFSCCGNQWRIIIIREMDSSTNSTQAFQPLPITSTPAVPDAADKVLAGVKDKLTAEMQALDRDVAAAAQKLSGLDFGSSSAREILKDLLPDRPYVPDVVICSRNGTIVTIEPTEYRGSEGAVIENQDHVMKLFRTRAPVMSSSFLAVEGFWAVVLVHPIFDANRNITGSIAAVIKPETLLGNIISEGVKGTVYDIWVMQPDGRTIYDLNTEEIGLNNFIAPMYQAFPQFVDFSRVVAQQKTGSSQYSFLDNTMNKTVNKAARWVTYSIHGTEWRLILIEVIK